MVLLVNGNASMQNAIATHPYVHLTSFYVGVLPGLPPYIAVIEGLGTRLELEQFIKSCILSIYDHEAEYVGMRNKYVCNAVYTDCAIVTKCSNYATKEVRLESVKDQGDHVYHSTGPQRSSAISVYLC